MAEQFDPYHRWLGIRPEEQPADHYRLLGLSRFENDPEVVRDAAEQRIRHVRTYQLGPHRKLTQKILNELAAARACLLDDARRLEYDQRLRQAVVEQEKRDRPQPPPIRRRFPAPSTAIGTKPKDVAPFPPESSKIGESAGTAIDPPSRRASPDAASKPKAPRQRDRHAVRPFADLRKVPARVIAGARQAVAGAVSGLGWLLTRPVQVGILGVLAVLSVIAMALMLGSPDEPESVQPRGPIVGIPEKPAIEMPEPPVLILDLPRREAETLTALLVDGVPQQLPPTRQYVLSAGRHRIVLRRDGFQQISDEILLVDGLSRRYDPQWRPIAVESPEPKDESAEPKPDGGDAEGEPMAFMLGSRVVEVPEKSAAKEKPADRPAESAEKTADLPPDAKEPAANIAADKAATRKQPTDSPSRPPLTVAPFAATQARQHQKAWADYLGVEVDITNSIDMRLVLIPPGEFMMGSLDSEEDRRDNEHQHRVRITKAFYLGVYEVTQAEYEQVMGRNPSHFSSVSGQDTSRFPVETVSWDDAVEFCRKLGAHPAERTAGRVYRLPTEAEWEHACRAGTATPFHFGTQLNGREANCNGNYPYRTEAKGPYLARTTTVGSYSANAFGLYDMHGNVLEWCQDLYDWEYYRTSPMDDPTGPSEASNRVLRGGCCFYYGGLCRSAYRTRSEPGNRDHPYGFRVALGR